MTFFEALVLVLIVVFLFLQNWRTTLIPMLAVPVSLIATFAAFQLLGFTINTLSLFGMVLAIGIVVDDAIVVVEAVEHNMSRGLAVREATIKAMEEVQGPVVAIALILAAVFIPMGFIPGVTGQLYKQFAVTVAVSTMFSALVALTLTPALCLDAAQAARRKARARGALFRPLQRRVRLAQCTLRHGRGDARPAHRSWSCSRSAFSWSSPRACSAPCRRASSRTKTRARCSCRWCCRTPRRRSARKPCCARSSRSPRRCPVSMPSSASRVTT